MCRMLTGERFVQRFHDFTSLLLKISPPATLIDFSNQKLENPQVTFSDYP